MAALAAALLLAISGLQPRLRAERGNRTVAFIVENRDVISLAYLGSMTQQRVWTELKSAGASGMTVAEYSGEELMNLNPMPVRFGPSGALGIDPGEAEPDIAVVIFEANMPYTEQIYEYLCAKLPSTRKIQHGDEVVLVLPGTVEHFRQSAFMPDFKGLDFCRENNIPIILRPGPCLSADGESVARSLQWLIERYPQIINITSSGAIMAGYPNIAPVAKVLKESGVTYTQVEFFNQIGAGAMTQRMAPDILPLHSIIREEIISRRMSPLQIRERLVRAVHERSVRLLIMRPYDLHMGGRLPVFLQDMSAVRADLEARGYSFGWPAPLQAWRASLFGAAACALAFLFCLWFYAARFLGAEEGKAAPLEVAALLLLSLVGIALLYKVPLLARLAGGLGAAFVAAEAALAALNSYKKPVGGVLLGLFVVMAGGLSLASFYGTSLAALRLAPFSGVKMTLLLPPLLVLLHDFRRRIHPEGISDVLARPALWAELALIGAMLLGLLVMALRSDNVSSVPAFEVAFRDFMERALRVRPRTKEFLVGYPLLILYYYVMKKNWAARYREAMRVGASLAFSSAVNTFCHFHTMLLLSVVRVVNGWWLGIIAGLAAVLLLRFIAVPLWRKGVREVFR